MWMKTRTWLLLGIFEGKDFIVDMRERVWLETSGRVQTRLGHERREGTREWERKSREGKQTKRKEPRVAKMADLYRNEKLEKGKWSLAPELERFRIRGRMKSAEKSHSCWVESRPSCLFFNHTTNWPTSLPSLLCFWMFSSFLKTWEEAQLEDWAYLLKCLLYNLRTKVQIPSS